MIKIKAKLLGGGLIKKITGFTQGGHESLAVSVIMEDRFAVVVANHQMINHAGIIQPQLPGHDDQLNLSTKDFKQSGLTPLLER